MNAFIICVSIAREQKYLLNIHSRFLHVIMNFYKFIIFWIFHFTPFFSIILVVSVHTLITYNFSHKIVVYVTVNIIVALYFKIDLLDLKCQVKIKITLKEPCYLFNLQTCMGWFGAHSWVLNLKVTKSLLKQKMHNSIETQRKSSLNSSYSSLMRLFICFQALNTVLNI